MAVVITTIIISCATSMIVAAVIAILGCYGTKIYIEKEVNRILDEEGMRTEEHVLEMIETAKKLIGDTCVNK